MKPLNESEHLSFWRGAGLMLTYWCSAQCRFCYVSAAPRHVTWADPRQVVRWWSALERIAQRYGEHAKVHLTGGEPFGKPSVLFELLELARRAGLPPVENVETNAFWAADDVFVRACLEKLKSFAVKTVVTDADVFHQEFVALDHVKRLVEIGRQVLGQRGVRVRWWDFYNRYVDGALDISTLSPDEVSRLQADALTSGRERITGRAAVLAAQLFTGRPPEAFTGQHCRTAILKSRHVHIDPHGNVFPGVCCGLVFGNAVNEELDEVFDWLNRHGPAGPVFDALLNEGPCGLIEFANRYRFTPLRQGYVTKCQLCYHLRTTLFHAHQCHKWLGPKECYPQWDD